jgi:DNA-binding transcriptional LysR family regulator
LSSPNSGMHRRYERINIPIEIVRTLVAVAENGSLSKAANLLDLSQPAISAQIKRLQKIVGCEVFRHSHSGVALTERGRLILSHARRMLEENDQIFALGGGNQDSQSIRLGLSVMYAPEFFKSFNAADFSDRITVFCGHSHEIRKNIAEGHLDVTCAFNPSKDVGDLDSHWIEKFCWVRSRNFVMSPGSPIPVICSAGNPRDEPTIQALEKKGLAYRIVFTSPDYGSRLAAAATGIGIIGIPHRHATGPLVVANEYYLPPLMSLAAGIQVRKGLQTDTVEQIVRSLKMLSPEARSSEAA